MLMRNSSNFELLLAVTQQKHKGEDEDEEEDEDEVKNASYRSEYDVDRSLFSSQHGAMFHKIASTMHGIC